MTRKTRGLEPITTEVTYGPSPQGTASFEIDPGWTTTVTVDSQGRVERLMIEPSPVPDTDVRGRICSNCGHVTMEDSIRNGDPTKPGPAPAGGITTRMVRRLALGDLARQTLAIAADEVHALAKLVDAPSVRVAAEAIRNEPVRPGRRGRNDSFYAAIAAAYVDANRTHPKSPVKHLHEVLNLSVGQVRDLLSEARRRDILSRVGKGQAGGQLTDHGRRVLEGRAG